MDELINLLTRIRDFSQQSAVLMVDIAHYLCFGIAIILLITSVAADVRGGNIGFNAGRWAIAAAVVGACILVARNIYGV